MTRILPDILLVLFWTLGASAALWLWHLAWNWALDRALWWLANFRLTIKVRRRA